MGEPITGSWSRIYTVPYSGAAKWGTGINPIHQFYGEQDSPLRVYGRDVDRNIYPGAQREAGITAPFEASPDFIETSAPWGYQPEDIAGLDVYQISSEDENRRGVPYHQDDWPDWSETTPQTRAAVNVRSRPPLGVAGRLTTALLRFGPYSDDAKVSKQVPVETVSEGWVNKLASGMDIGQTADDVVVSDPSQYEIQTSMTQRHKTQNNNRALLRGTDDPRYEIPSRIAPMKIKAYSGGQRHYDMDPYQMDDIPRAFWYRRAGTGRIAEMNPNEMFVIQPLQRTPPPDPSMGPAELTVSDPNYDEGFGYTGEDQGWY